MKKIVLILLFIQIFLFGNATILNNPIEDSTRISFYEIEFRTGKMFPNNERFIPSGPLSSLLLTYGVLNYNNHKQWAKFHNFPLTGITIGLTNLGSPNLYGYEVKAIPFVEYVIGKKMKNRPTLKVGLGIGYTTQHFRTNKKNFSLGSPVNWAFEFSLRHNLIKTKFGLIRVGVGYIHSSNGHTQLPNMGINAVVANLSLMQLNTKSNYKVDYSFEKIETKRQITYFLQLNPIIGFHELGGPLGPQYGPKRRVYGTNIMAGLFLNGGFKFYIGFGYRFYEHFYNIYNTAQHPDIKKSKSPFGFASNIYFLNGIELIYGHFGFTFEGGLNLYKPFYKVYCDLYSPENPTKYLLKKYLNSRIGLKGYLYNASNDPEYNIFVGAHVNANLGQADFTEISIGVVHRLDFQKKNP